MFKRLYKRLHQPVITYEPSKKIKNIVFLVFVLTSTLFVYFLTSSLAEERIFTPAVGYFFIMLILFLGYVFRPVWLGVFLLAGGAISVIIDIFLNPIDVRDVYIAIKNLNELENELAYNIVSQIAPQFLQYRLYFLLGGYLVFEALLIILGRSFRRLGFQFKWHPFETRFYFITVLILIDLILSLIF